MLSGIHSGALSKALKAALVLHPIAAGLALLALIFGLLMARPTRGTTRFSSLLAALTSLLAALVATAAFVVDIVAGAVIRRHVHQDGVSLKYGNAVWMVLGAMVALWLALITATCGIFQLRRHRRAQQTTY
jgi:disulfide bond formation protein DsbB